MRPLAAVKNPVFDFIMKNTYKLLILLITIFTVGCQKPNSVNNPMTSTARPDLLWQEAKAELIARGFTIDFQNRTAGIIETMPLVSKQWFELWKDDVVTTSAVAKSSLQTTRRTVKLSFNWHRNPVELECIADIDKLYITPDSKSDSTKTDDVFVANSRLLRRKNTKGSMDWDNAGRDNDLEQAILKSINLRLSDESYETDKSDDN